MPVGEGRSRSVDANGKSEGEKKEETNKMETFTQHASEQDQQPCAPYDNHSRKIRKIGSYAKFG